MPFAQIGRDIFDATGEEVVTLSDGTFLVAGRTGGADAANGVLKYQRYNVDGTAIGAVGYVAQDGLGLASIAAFDMEPLPGGGFAILARGPYAVTELDDLWIVRVGPDGALQGNWSRVNGATDLDQQHGGFDVNAAGQIGVAYSDNSADSFAIPLFQDNAGGYTAQMGEDVHASIFAANGTPVINDREITEGLQGTPSGSQDARAWDQRAGQPAMLENGVLAVPYADFSLVAAPTPGGFLYVDRVGVQLVFPDGQVSNETNVWTGENDGIGATWEPPLVTQQVSAVALNGGGFAVVWQLQTLDENDQPNLASAYVRFFSQGGAALTEPINFLQRSRGNTEDIGLAPLDNGGFAAAYVIDDQIRIAAIGPDGSVIADAVMGTDAPGFNTWQSIDQGPDGTITVAWTGGIGTVVERWVLAEDGAEVTTGHAGHDTLTGSVLADWIDGAGSNDLLTLGAGADNGWGSTGEDTLLGQSGNDSLSGGNGNDSLDGGIGFDALTGDAGNDTLTGSDGHDVLSGGVGNDLLTGNTGFDTLLGGEGQDTLLGGLGTDSLDGGAGDDLLSGQSGGDTLAGGDGQDTLNGQAGDDSLSGGAGDDVLTGGINRDTLEGDGGADTLSAGNGSDLLSGGEGDDRLEGNAGSDTLDGGAGSDVLRGGVGADTFVFGPGAGVDVVADFQTNIDTLQIDRALLSEAVPVPADLAHYAQINATGQLVLDFGSTVITLASLGALTPLLDDVVFV